MVFYNPFDHINWEKVQGRVERTRDSMRGGGAPETKEAVAALLISNKCKWLAGVGIASGLPSFIPGAGQVMAALGGVTIDLGVTMYLLAELVVEVAVVYGRKPCTEGTSREAFWVITLALGGEAIGTGVSKYAIMHASKRTFLRVVQVVLARLGLRVTQRVIARFVPAIGSAVSAGMNASLGKVVGATALRWYKENPEPEEGWLTAPSDH